MIVGTRVYLRPIAKDDLPCLNKWRNDEETFKFLGGGFLPISIDHQAKWLDSYIDTTGSDKRFMICKLENHKPIGMVGLYNIKWIDRVSEIGIFIGKKNATGKGYANEACQLLERFAWQYLNLRKIKLNVVSENRNAIRLWKKLGYRIVGEYVRDRFIGGKYLNVLMMEKFNPNEIG